MKTSLDMHNTVTGKRLERILSLQLDALEKNPSLAKTLPPLMVWGAPGLGKSSIIRKAADDRGIGFIDVRLAQREPVDIRGLPVPDKDGVKWLVSSDWPRDPKSRGIILFDELTAADRSLQVAAYEFILDRRLGELYRVPDGWYICAAGNRTEDRAVAATMSSALANRFMHVELGGDVESWVAWAQHNDIRPCVTAFLRFRPEMLFRQDGENLERGWPSPRSWERVSRMLDVTDGEEEELQRSVVHGIVGDRAGMEFMEFRKLSEQFDDVRKLMLDPEAKIIIPQRADLKYALCAAVAYHVWRGETDEEGRRLLDGFYRICIALTSDFASMLMMDVMSGSKRISRNAACERLFANPGYKPWAKKHGTALRAHIAV
ncbi:MAG: hypothetical protein ILM98_08160 [Kiritimatiellae bacterium]|nr:hypothetical protein [Kiritimatiellia bacterium]